jgi:hypothetical protein
LSQSQSHSILDVAGCLPAVLLGFTFVLPALRVGLLVGSPAILFCVAGALACFLSNITSSATLLSLFGCHRIPGRDCQQDCGESHRAPSIP